MQILTDLLPSCVTAFPVTAFQANLKIAWEAHINEPVDALSGERSNQFKREYSWTQRCGDVTDDLLWIYRVLVNQRDLLLSERHRVVQFRLLGLVLPLHRGAGAFQQLHQPYDLRCEVSRVPDGRQTPAADQGSCSDAG